MLAEGEEVLLAKGIDMTFRVFFNDPVVGEKFRIYRPRQKSMDGEVGSDERKLWDGSHIVWVRRATLFLGIRAVAGSEQGEGFALMGMRLFPA